MDATTKQWIRASEAWLKDTEHTITGNQLEKDMLQKQIILNKKRIALLDEQVAFYKKSMGHIRKRIASLKTRR